MSDALPDASQRTTHACGEGVLARTSAKIHERCCRTALAAMSNLCLSAHIREWILSQWHGVHVAFHTLYTAVGRDAKLGPWLRVPDCSPSLWMHPNLRCKQFENKSSIYCGCTDQRESQLFLELRVQFHNQARAAGAPPGQAYSASSNK